MKCSNVFVARTQTDIFFLSSSSKKKSLPLSFFAPSSSSSQKYERRKKKKESGERAQKKRDTQKEKKEGDERERGGLYSTPYKILDEQNPKQSASSVRRTNEQKNTRRCSRDSRDERCLR